MTDPTTATRRALVEHSRRLVADGLCVGTSGNLSVRVDDQILITPSGVDPQELRPDEIVSCALDGTVSSPSLRPSSELPLHLSIYTVTDAGAVVHTHSRHATALSTVLDELPAIHYTINNLGGPVRVAPYATFGTDELADNVRVALRDRTAALLANHGAVAYAASLPAAFDRAVLLEWLAEVYWRASQLGPPRILTPDQLTAVREQARLLRYGDPVRR